jgi:cytochrome c oxidase subunit 1/cytochrome c oxidase subunit I+III
VVNVWWSHHHGEVAPPNPWEADSLEWAIPSPTPEWNFTEIPQVVGRHPLWDGHLAPAAVDTEEHPDLAAEVVECFGVEGALRRQTPITSGLATEPEGILRIPKATYMPFVAALGVAGIFVGLLIYAPLAVALGVGIGLVAIARWTWRTEADLV